MVYYMKRYILIIIFIFLFSINTLSNDIFYDNENYNYYNIEHYLSIVEHFENGNTISFNTKEESLDFIKWYFIDYRLSSEQYIYYHNDNINDYKLRIDIPTYNRESTKNTIIEVFGNIDNDKTRNEKIKDTLNKISIIQYDVNYYVCTIEKSVRELKGVCYHYAKIASELLRYSGEIVRVLQGYYKDKSHMWIKVYNGDRWIYCDPTYYRINKDEIWLDIPYDYYKENYKIIDTL